MSILASCSSGTSVCKCGEKVRLTTAGQWLVLLQIKLISAPIILVLRVSSLDWIHSLDRILMYFFPESLINRSLVIS